MTDRFATETNFQDDLLKDFFHSNKFVLAINESKNSLPNKCKKYSRDNS